MRKTFLSLVPQTVGLLVTLLLLSAPARADIASVQAEIAAINGQIAGLTNGQIIPLDNDINTLRQGMAEARTFMDEFAERHDWLESEYAAHQKRLREYEGRALQLSMSYLDFFNAKEAWEQSSNPAVRRTQILIMFRYLYGASREPSQWELNPNTQQDFVTLADLIVRKKAVARIGEALVLLGDLTVQLVDAITSVPGTMKEAVFQTIQFTVDTTIKLLPNDVVHGLNNTCLRYVPYLALQKQRAELLASQLNEIRQREEYGGENGRVEALAKAQALAAYERDVLAELEPELNDYLARKATVEANFVTVQGEINDKQQQLDTLKQTLRQYNQNKIDKEFELSQLQEQDAIAQNGGPTNYVNTLSVNASPATITTDALSSSLLNLARFAVLSTTAGYITEKAAQCSYTADQLTQYESYHTKQTFSSAATNAAWRKVNPTGDVTIVGNRAYGSATGTVPLHSALSPAFTGESYGATQHCSQDYIPTGSGEKLSAAVNIEVKKVEEALFLPYFYYAQGLKQGLSGPALFDAIKAAAETWGKGIDLFVGGTVQQWGSANLYHTIRHANGTRSFNYTAPKVRPEGELAAFEINNQMQALANGAATVWPLLFDKDGVPVPQEATNGLSVTGNTVLPTVTANGLSGLTPADNVTAVIGEASQFSIAVPGPADMNKYQVNWRLFIWNETGWPTGWVAFTRHDGAAVSQFNGAAGNWTSQNPVTLTDAADYNRKFKVEFDIVRKYDSVTVYAGKFENIQSLVKGKRFFLANKTTGAEYPGVNYFLFRGLNFLAPSITSVNLELRLDLGDGRSVLVPLSEAIKGLLYGTDDPAHQHIGTISLYEKYLYFSLSSIDTCGRVALGIFELKEADSDTLLSEGIVVERSQNTMMTASDVNLLRATYRETEAGPRYVLKSCGPTSLDTFTAHWTFFDESTAESPFSAIGLQQESQTPMPRSLKQVEIVNAMGASAATLGFLSASGPPSTNRIPAEVGMVYTVLSEYRFDASQNRHLGQLKRLQKNDLGRLNKQLEVDFQFPEGFPPLLVDTVHDINGQRLPYITDLTASNQKVTFNLTKPDANAYTLLTVLKPPVFGTLAIDGTGITYTPRAGFNQTDRFLLRIDGRVCDIDPDVLHYNLEAEIDLTGPRPLIRFQLIFTPVFQYGNYDLGFALTDANRQALSGLSVSQAPAALTVDVASNVVGIKTGALPANSRDLFTLHLTTTDGATGVATLNLLYHTAYPEFTAYKNQDYLIPREFITHRFFQHLSDVQYVKLDYWFNGAMLLRGQPLNYNQPIPVADLNDLTFRPTADFTGPTAFGGRGSADGSTTWTNQIRIGGRVIEGTGNAGLAELIRLLQILAGKAMFAPDSAIVPDIDGDGKVGLPEAVYTLLTLAN